MKRGSRPWIDGTFQGPDECMELVALHLHRLGVAQAEVVTFLADGAQWIWERLAWVERRVGLPAERVVRVLDWCHAVHDVSLALEALALPLLTQPLVPRIARTGRRRQALRHYMGF